MNEQNETNLEKSPEEIKTENKKMIRACISGVIIIALFIGVYFIFGGQKKSETADDNPKTKTEQSTNTNDNTKSEEQTDKKTENQESTATSDKSTTEDIYKKYDIKYTRDEALKEAEFAAKEQFGDDAFVIPASDEDPTEVEIDGKMRACYMFGADSMSNLSEENASMRGLYHFDAVTGEIFDNANGNMVKIK